MPTNSFKYYFKHGVRMKREGKKEKEKFQKKE
jgi:hypothetical protein